MKKFKVLAALFLTCLATSLCALTLTACGGDSDSDNEHNLTFVPEQSPTCTVNGNIAYYLCTHCNKMFTDENATKETTWVIISALGHTPETIEGVEATCTTDGLTDGRKCSVCQIVLKGQDKIPASHKYENGICTVCHQRKVTDGLEYALSSDGTYYVLSDGYYAEDRDVYIPSKLNDLPVASIGENAFKNCSRLTSITIPDSITSIGDYAFSGCSGLTSVTIGNGVTSIGESAFSGCSGLTSITIPDSVTSIGDEAFYGCSSLASVTIGKGLSSIGDDAFNHCSSLTSITIPNSVTAIGSGALNRCSSLTTIIVSEDNANYKSIDGNLYSKDGKTLIQYAIGKTDTAFTIPDIATSIGDDAFYYCSNLTSITIPDNVTSIGSYAFDYCSGLTSVTIPDNVTSIGKYAFYNCTALTEIKFNATACDDFSSDNCVFAYAGQRGEGIKVTIGANVTKIPAYLFYPSSCSPNIISVEFEEGSVCQSIGRYAFRYCSSLTSIAIPDSVTVIDYAAFNGCDKLVEVYNLSNLKITKGSSDNGEIAYYALNVYTSASGESKLHTKNNYIFYEDGVTVYLVGYIGNTTDIALPDNYNDKNYSIYQYAFYNCSNLTSVTIPDGVTSIGEYAFRGCSSLESATIGSGVTTIGEYAFSGCSSLESATIGSGVTTIGDYAFFGCYSLASVTIPNSVTSIGDEAFRGCSSLKSATIGSGVTTIGDYSFHGCDSLTSVTIPNNVTSIGDYAFRCSRLKSITVAEDNANYKSIDGNLYSKDGKTLIQYAIGKTDKAFTIPNGVTSIGNYAFAYCSSLTSVTMPNSVTSIGEAAFLHCNSLISVTISDGVISIGASAFYGYGSLSTVYYAGTEAGWNAITIGSSNNKLTSATRYYYSETQPTNDGNYWHYVNGEIAVWTKNN